MFESLTEKLTGSLGKLKSKGRLSEKDVDDALRDVRLAMLEACLLYTSPSPRD